MHPPGTGAGACFAPCPPALSHHPLAPLHVRKRGRIALDDLLHLVLQRLDHQAAWHCRLRLQRRRRMDSGPCSRPAGLHPAGVASRRGLAIRAYRACSQQGQGCMHVNWFGGVANGRSHDSMPQSCCVQRLAKPPRWTSHTSGKHLAHQDMQLHIGTRAPFNKFNPLINTRAHVRVRARACIHTVAE